MAQVAVPTLVETGWLEENMADASIRIVDASWHLPAAGRNAAEEFKNAHVPGAVFWDIDDVADRSSSLPHMMPDEATFARHMGALGISNDHHVVVYDNVSMMTSARAWWMLRAFGHNRVSLLNGGQVKWQSEGRPVSAAPEQVPNVEFTAVFDPAMIRSLDDVQANIQSGAAQMLDARSAGRFAGIDPEPRPECRSGHIPGSLNLPFNTLIDPATATVLPKKELSARLAAAGIDPERPVITSCGSGITACVLALAMHLTGKEDVAVYDGSWTEWGSRADTPVET